ncbi:MAG TPA: SDR family oxidoreductase [Bryobacteraceae bacterium]|nr:SDR family oxidoreductase [Bryobacteraceae bacterium]
MENQPSSLAGRVVLVTGGAKRIGRGIALRLAREGARVAIHYNRSEAEARETAEQCGGAELFRANLERVSEIEAMFADLEGRLGGLYGLVNNAARFTHRDMLDLTEEEWDFMLDVNLKAVFFCAKEAALRMKRAGEGRIVNISSLGGIRPWAQRVHYSASKAGVIMLTRAMAKALAPGITVNSIAPGVIPFHDIDPEGIAMLGETPAQRGGTAAEIADAVVYFLKTSNFVTGQILAVDGGLSLK